MSPRSEGDGANQGRAFFASPRHCSRAIVLAVARKGGFSERGRGETVDAADFTGVPARKLAEQNRSNSGKAKGANLGQSRAKPLSGEGVETRRAAPTAEGYGEGIVQTTNADTAAAKVEVVRKSAPRKGVGVRVPPSAPAIVNSAVAATTC